jgi:hypothetical protein
MAVLLIPLLATYVIVSAWFLAEIPLLVPRPASADVVVKLLGCLKWPGPGGEVYFGGGASSVGVGLLPGLDISAKQSSGWLSSQYSTPLLLRSLLLAILLS